MSEKLAQLMKKGGGGGLKKTVLWTRPSSQTSFGEETLTLSDDVNNYDYIGFHFAGRNPTQAGHKEYDIIIPIETYNDSYRDNSSFGNSYIVLGYVNGSSAYYRIVYKLTDTTLKVSKRYDGGYTDLACAPIEIYGLK